MHKSSRFAVAAVTLSIALAQPSPPSQAPSTPQPLPPVLANYQPVTAERLKKPEDGNWLMIRRTYDGWGRQQVRLLHHARTPGRGRQGFAGRLRRGIWNSRVRRGLRPRNRQGAVAYLYGARARRTRQRNLAQRRPMEDPWRAGLGYRK